MWLCLKYQLPLARQGSGSRYGGGLWEQALEECGEEGNSRDNDKRGGERRE